MKPVHVKGNEKICKNCNLIKIQIEFPLRGRYRLNTCTICYNEQENYKQRLKYREDYSYREEKRLSAYKNTIRSRYKVELEDVVKTLELQHFKCANPACGDEISLTAPKELVKRAVVDHDHVTGKFRALLCNRCNIVLGHLEKNPLLFDGLKEYLKRFQTNSMKG